MPTYVYGCDICGHRFEKVQRFSDDPIKVCPECEGKVRRIFQPAGIVFKGSGWHINDYKRAGQADSDAARAESVSQDKGAKAESVSQEKSAKAEGSSKDGKEGSSKDGKESSSKAKEGTAKESSAKSGGSDTAPASPAS